MVKTLPKNSKAQDVPEDIKKLSEEPITDVPLPSGLEPRFNTASRKISDFNLAELENMDPVQALQILTLREKLEAARKVQVEKQSQAEFQLRMLQEVEREIEMREAAQRVCASNGHMRENHTSALMGQTDSGGKYCLTCVRCHQFYVGVGNGPRELPQHLANTVDWQNCGKSH